MEETRRLSDDELVELYFAREEKALRETDRIYGRELFDLSYRILADREDAEENQSDTYLAAWRSMPPTRPYSLCAYLHRICRNLALKRIARKNRQKRSARIVELTDEIAGCLPGGNVEEEADTRELGRLLSAFLKTLEQEDRFILMARCFHMDSTTDIAAVLGCSEGSVRTRLYRTRLKLKKYLEKNWEGLK